jgi:putative pyruvate formate lyase activating enzyme
MLADHNTPQPAYLALLDSGELNARVEAAREHLKRCDLCPWECHIDRMAGRLGACKTSRRARVASAFPHFGEEAPLTGTDGSGTIFFSHCNMRCVYCQNYTISAQGEGATRDPEEVAAMMLALQEAGCHNINLVSPSHVVAQIIEALAIAAREGLHLPLVYNTGGYDSLPALALLDGIIDIYMPDVKYSDSGIAREHSKVKDYVRHNRAALHEMHRQVGDLALDERGIATRGLLVRHLVLPDDLAGTAEVAVFLADEISPDTYLNLMVQYRPAYRAASEDLGPLSRPVSAAEMAEAYDAARQAGLHRFDAA